MPCTHSEALPGKTTKIWAVGERVHALVADAGLAPVGLLSVPTSVDAITPLVGQILIEIEAALEQGDVGEVYVFHNHPKFGAVYEPVSKRLLPLDQPGKASLPQCPGRQSICRKSSKEPRRRFRLSFADTCLSCCFKRAPNPLPAKTPAAWRRCNERKRTSADILEDLNRKFHRVRQESIDEELFDVISGFEALTAQGAPHPKNLARRTIRWARHS